MKLLKRSCLFALIVFYAVFGYAQGQKEIVYALSVQPLHAWFFVHSKRLQPFEGVKGFGLQADLKRYRKDQTAFDYSHRYFSSGYTLQWMHFTDSRLGNALNLAYFIEPILYNQKEISIRLRAAGGMNLSSNPYDATNNPVNVTYSTSVNGYLGLGMSANLRINNKTSAFFNATYSHFSNGNTKNPNYGLNFPNIGAGIEWDLKTAQKPLGKLLFYPEHWRFDIAGFLCNKSLPTFPKNRYWAYGAYGQASYKYATLHGVTLGLEAYEDKSLRVDMDSNNVYGGMKLDNRLIGLLFGHEFLFNKCIFSQQLGVYLYKEVPGEFVNRVYHRWGFNYKLNRRLMVGMNLNANLQKAFIFDGRLIYSFYHP